MTWSAMSCTKRQDVRYGSAPSADAGTAKENDTMELKERVQALMDWLFGFGLDQKRCDMAAVEIADEMNAMNPGIDWDHVDGLEFTDMVSKAVRRVRDRDRWLFM